MRMKLKESDNGRFGDSVTVYYGGIEVAFIQGYTIDALSKIKLRNWVQNAFCDYRDSTQLREHMCFANDINRLNGAYFAKRNR